MKSIDKTSQNHVNRRLVPKTLKEWVMAVGIFAFPASTLVLLMDFESMNDTDKLIDEVRASKRVQISAAAVPGASADNDNKRKGRTSESGAVQGSGTANHVRNVAADSSKNEGRGGSEASVASQQGSSSGVDYSTTTNTKQWRPSDVITSTTDPEALKNAIQDYLKARERELDEKILFLSNQYLQLPVSEQGSQYIGDMDLGGEAKLLIDGRTRTYVSSYTEESAPFNLTQHGPNFSAEDLKNAGFTDLVSRIKQKERSYFMLLTHRFTPSSLRRVYSISQSLHRSLEHYDLFLSDEEVDMIFMLGESGYILSQKEVDASRMTSIADAMLQKTQDDSVPATQMLLERFTALMRTKDQLTVKGQTSSLVQAVMRYFRGLPMKNLANVKVFDGQKSYFDSLHNSSLVEMSNSRVKSVLTMAREAGASGYAGLTGRMYFHQLLSFVQILRDNDESQRFVNTKQQLLALLRNMQRSLVNDRSGALKRVEDRLSAIEQM
jgi:hypothetical protein